MSQLSPINIEPLAIALLWAHGIISGRWYGAVGMDVLCQEFARALEIQGIQFPLEIPANHDKHAYADKVKQQLHILRTTCTLTRQG